jgi:hypothetical protein
VNKYIRFNGDTGSNYSRTFVYGDGSSRISGRSTSTTGILLPTSTTRYTEIHHIASYANTSVNKTVLYSFSMSSYIVGRMVSLWRSTAAIDTLLIASGDTTFAWGSTFDLYGLRGA